MQWYSSSGILSRNNVDPAGHSLPPGHWRVSTSGRLENSSHSQNKISWTAQRNTVSIQRNL